MNDTTLTDDDRSALETAGIPLAIAARALAAGFSPTALVEVMRQHDSEQRGRLVIATMLARLAAAGLRDTDIMRIRHESAYPRMNRMVTLGFTYEHLRELEFSSLALERALDLAELGLDCDHASRAAGMGRRADQAAQALLRGGYSIEDLELLIDEDCNLTSVLAALGFIDEADSAQVRLLTARIYGAHPRARARWAAEAARDAAGQPWADTLVTLVRDGMPLQDAIRTARALETDTAASGNDDAGTGRTLSVTRRSTAVSLPATGRQRYAP